MATTSTPRFAGVSPAQRRALNAVWASIRACLPSATVTRKYGIDCFALEGVVVGGLAGYKEHNSYFPFSGGVVSRLGRIPKSCSASQGTLRFPFDTPLSPTIVRRLVKLRLGELASVDHGRRVVTFPNGQIKAVGMMRRGELHGPWKWYRKDGSLLRTGSFRDGVAVGSWRTYDRSGRLVTGSVKTSTSRASHGSARPVSRASRSRSKSPRRP